MIVLSVCSIASNCGKSPQLIHAKAIKITVAVSQDEKGDGTTPPWTQHKDRFVRIAFHLRYRANRATCEDEDLLRQYKELEPQLHEPHSTTPSDHRT